MASILDILSGSEPDAQEMANATTAALRRRQLLAEMGGTVPGLAPSATIAAHDIGNQGKMLEAAGVGRLHYGQEAQALKQAIANAKNQNDLMREMMRGQFRLQAAATPGHGMIDPGDANAIADAIEKGIQPPTVQGLYRNAGPVRAALAKRGYDYTTANMDWQAVQKHLASLNSTQQTRLRQSIDFAYHSLDQIENLYDRWRQVGPASGFKVLNKGALATARNLPGEAGAVAQGLHAQINDLTEALGSVYMGGNTPTDNAFKLAQENLKGEWNEETFKKSLGLVRNNLQMRRNSMLHTQPAGLSPGSRFGGESPAAGGETPKKRLKWNPEKGVAE